MSHTYYSTKWRQAMETLSSLLNEENPSIGFDDKRRPTKPATLSFYDAFKHSAVLYYKYLTLFRHLEDVHDGMVHPQKRADVKLALELVMARLCQLKQQMMLYSSSQLSALTTPDRCHWEHFLLQCGVALSSRDFEVPIPRCFRELSDDSEERKRRDLVDTLLEEQSVAWGQPVTAGPVSEEMQTKLAVMNKLSKEQAIAIIAKNERGRQGAMRARLMRELREEDARKRRAEAGLTLSLNDAATKIQAVWRSYRARQQVRKEDEEELVFIGLKSATKPAPPGMTTANGAARYDPLVKSEQIRAQRKTRQLDAALHFADSLPSLQSAVSLEEGDVIKDELWDARYKWWNAEKEKNGKFPESLDVYYQQCFPDSEEAKAAALKQAAATKGKGKKEKGKKGDAKAEKKAEKPKSPPAADSKPAAKGKPDAKDAAEANVRDPNSLVLGPSLIVSQLTDIVNHFHDVWQNLDETSNPDQSFDESMAKAKIRPLVESRIRKQVDQRMQIYFDQVKAKLAERETSQSNQVASKKKGKGKSGQSRPSTQNKPREEESKVQFSGDDNATEAKQAIDVDALQSSTTAPASMLMGNTNSMSMSSCSCDGAKLCSSMPLQDCLALLVKMNLIRSLPVTQPRYPANSTQPPPTSTLAIQSLQGDYNPVLGAQSQSVAAADAGQIFPLTNQELRSLLTEHFILPQGSSFVKSQVSSPRSLLLFGSSGSGKSLAARIVAKESGSLWFDLSAKNLEKKLGTKGEIAKLCHLIFHCAQRCQPSVIYIDEVEKLFVGAKTKKSNAEMLRFRALLMQHLDQLDPHDRVILIGCSRSPQADFVDQKDLLSVFGSRAKHGAKVVWMAPPDHATRIKLWRSFIEQQGLSVDALEAKKQPAFNLAILASVSEGFTAGSIEQAVLATLPPRRVSKMLELDLGLSTHELINALSQTAYVWQQDHTSSVAFVEQVQGLKEKRKLREQAVEAQKAAELAAAAQPKKGKK